MAPPSRKKMVNEADLISVQNLGKTVEFVIDLEMISEFVNR